jgi:hypothetical protein
MCRFYSLLSNENKDGEVQVFHFTPELRKSCPANANNFVADNFDSHSSIAHYFLLNSYLEDKCNKWEYNPFTDCLDLDDQNLYDYDGQTEKHEAAVRAALAGINWNLFFNNFDVVKDFIKSIESTDWSQRNEFLPEGVRVFDSDHDAKDYWDCLPGDRSQVEDQAYEWLKKHLKGRVAEAIQEATPYMNDHLSYDIQLHIMDMCVAEGAPENIREHLDRRWAVVKAGYHVVMEYNGEPDGDTYPDTVLFVVRN